MKTPLTFDRLHSLLIYDDATGIFTWRKSRGTAKAGSIAGSLSSDGYIRIKIDNTLYLAHRLVWFYSQGAWPTCDLDHRNQIKNDNRIQNLREVNRSENSQNISMKRTNTSGFRGVSWNKKAQKWNAQIKFQYKRYHLGYYNTAEEASIAYQLAAEKLHTHRPGT